MIKKTKKGSLNATKNIPVKLIDLESNSTLTASELKLKEPEKAKSLFAKFQDGVTKKAVNIIKGRSKVIDEVLDSIDLTIAVDDSTKSMKVSEAAITALRNGVKNNSAYKDDENIRNEITKVEEELKRLPDKTISESIGLDKPIGSLPEFRDDMQLKKMKDLGLLAGLNEDERMKIMNKAGKINFLTNAKIRTMVHDKDITPEQSIKLENATALYMLLDQNYVLANSL
ncbi:MAG: hypothetical protein EHM28_11470, partial [Spirochaetaceae bacterium]